jgi:hypothetical protein
MSAKTLLSAPDVHTTRRGGVGQRTRIGKTAKGAMFLFARAGVVVSVVLYVKGRGSVDAQQAMVVTLTIYWTVVTVTLIWMIDGFVRALRGRFDKEREGLWRPVYRVEKLDTPVLAAPNCGNLKPLRTGMRGADGKRPAVVPARSAEPSRTRARNGS